MLVSGCVCVLMWACVLASMYAYGFTTLSKKIRQIKAIPFFLLILYSRKINNLFKSFFHFCQKEEDYYSKASDFIIQFLFMKKTATSKFRLDSHFHGKKNINQLLVVSSLSLPLSLSHSLSLSLSLSLTSHSFSI